MTLDTHFKAERNGKAIVSVGLLSLEKIEPAIIQRSHQSVLYVKWYTATYYRSLILAVKTAHREVTPIDTD